MFHHIATINTLLMLFYGPEQKKQIFSYKIRMPFVWIILIKGRLTNQFFPEKRAVKSLKIDFFRLRLGTLAR